MHTAIRPYTTAGIVILGASVIAIAPMAQPASLESHSVQLAAEVGPPQQLVQNVLGTTGLVSMALLNQIPDVAVFGAGVTALKNLAGNVPIAVDAAIAMLAEGDVLGAVQAVGGVVLNAVLGFAQGAVGDIVEVVSAISSLVPQMFVNLGIAIPAAIELAFQGQFGEAASALLGPVLNTVGGIAGVTIPGLLPILGAAGSLIPQMFTNLTIAVPAAIELVLQGQFVSALQTVVGPVLSAASGIVGVAIPGLFPALNAASILLPQVIPNMAVAIPEALRLATELKFVSALNALLSPVFSAVAGIAGAALGPQDEEAEFATESVSEFRTTAIQVASDPVAVTTFVQPVEGRTVPLDLTAPIATDPAVVDGSVATEPAPADDEVLATDSDDETENIATESEETEVDTEDETSDTIANDHTAEDKSDGSESAGSGADADTDGDSGQTPRDSGSESGADS